MAKGDQSDNKKAIDTAQQASDTNTNAGLADERARLAAQAGVAKGEHDKAYAGYEEMSHSGGIDQSFIDYLSKPTVLGSGTVGGNSSGSSGGGGGGGGTPAAGPSYLDVFRELSGKSGGYDPTRLAAISGDANALRNTSGNYGDVNDAITGLKDINYKGTNDSIERLKNIHFNNASGAISDLGNLDYSPLEASAGRLRNIDQSGNQDTISKLKDYAATGGVSAADEARINRPIFNEFEQTGGYSAGDIANIRERSNRAVPSFYQNLTNSINRGAVGSLRNPGAINAATGNLARQAAQGTATASRDTEMGISDAVRSGRMDAAKTIAGNQIALQPIKNAATLGAYGTAGNLGLGVTGQQASNEAGAANIDLGRLGLKSSNILGAGNLDIARGTAEGNLARDAGNLSLGVSGQQASNLTSRGGLALNRQQQIDAARRSAAEVDAGLQDSINRSRLGGAGGLQTDELTRLGIGASSGAAAAARSDANARFNAQLDAENQRFLASGKQQGYSTGLAGMSGLAGSSNQNEQFNQGLLRGYGQDQAGSNLGLINSRIDNSKVPSTGANIMGNISSGLSIGSGLFGGFGGGFGIGGGASNLQSNNGGVPNLGFTQPGVAPEPNPGYIPGSGTQPSVSNPNFLPTNVGSSQLMYY